MRSPAAASPPASDSAGSAGPWCSSYPNDRYPNEGRRLAAFTGKELLIGEPGSDDHGDLSLTWSVFDLDYDGRLATLPSATTLPPTEGLGRPVVNRVATTVLIPFPEDGSAVYRTGGAAEWLPVPQPAISSGPLVPGLVLGDQVSLQGDLFNPETGTWRHPAALPDGPGPGAAQAAGPEAILSCFTLTAADELGSQCYLLSA